MRKNRGENFAHLRRFPRETIGCRLTIMGGRGSRRAEIADYSAAQQELRPPVANSARESAHPHRKMPASSVAKFCPWCARFWTKLVELCPASRRNRLVFKCGASMEPDTNPNFVH
jgi:hypothetical protein